jgi:hypothetical protein
MLYFNIIRSLKKERKKMNKLFFELVRELKENYEQLVIVASYAIIIAIIVSGPFAAAFTILYAIFGGSEWQPLAFNTSVKILFLVSVMYIAEAIMFLQADDIGLRSRRNKMVFRTIVFASLISFAFNEAFTLVPCYLLIGFAILIIVFLVFNAVRGIIYFMHRAIVRPQPAS